MRVKLRKVGNSYALTVPGEVMAEIGLAEGAELDVVVREDRVVYEPVTDTWDALREKLRAAAEAQGITESDIDRAVAEVRRGGDRKA